MEQNNRYRVIRVKNTRFLCTKQLYYDAIVLSDYISNDSIFVDANIFIYNALDNPIFAESCSDFLMLVETDKIRADSIKVYNPKNQ